MQFPFTNQLKTLYVFFFFCYFANVMIVEITRNKKEKKKKRSNISIEFMQSCESAHKQRALSEKVLQPLNKSGANIKVVLTVTLSQVLHFGSIKNIR